MERHYSAVTVAVPSALVPALKQELEEMTRRVLALCDGAEGERDRVLQVQLHFFPVTAASEEMG